MNLRHYISLLHQSLIELVEAFSDVADAHGDEPDVRVECEKFAKQTQRHEQLLRPFLEQFGANGTGDEPERLHRVLFDGTRDGPLGLIRDLHDLYLMSCQCEICWILVKQAAQGARTTDLTSSAQECSHDAEIQMAWLRSRMKQAAPQALVVAE